MTTRTLTGLLMIVSAGIGCRHTAAATAEHADAIERPAIVLVAFGTSPPEARKVFDHIDTAAKKRYPEHDIHWAFTSKFIRKKLKRSGIQTKSLQAVVDDLTRSGHTSAVCQSLHIAPGQEYHEIEQIDTKGLRVAVGKALLSDDDDIEAVIAALGGELKPDTINVVVCHGNRHHHEFNRQLVAFAKNIEARHDNVAVCSINGRPGTEKLTRARRAAARSGSVHFLPLMVVAGVHIAEDVLGDGADSWKNVVGATSTTCGKPLGYNDKVLAIYFQHLDEALADLQKQAHAGDRR